MPKETDEFLHTDSAEEIQSEENTQETNEGNSISSEQETAFSESEAPSTETETERETIALESEAESESESVTQTEEAIPPESSEEDNWEAEDPWGDSSEETEDLSDPEETASSDATVSGSSNSGKEEVFTDEMGNVLSEDEILEVEKSNYGGTQVVILQKDNTAHEMYAARREGELINDAVYARNKFVEGYLGVSLKFETAAVQSGGIDQLKERVNAAVMSGYSMYHIIANNTYEASSMIQEGAFLDINSIPAEENYIDLSKRWWNQSFHEESLLDQKLYMLVGDITTTAIDSAEVVFVNNDMLMRYTDLTEAELMEQVYEMKWTYETFLNMVHKVGNGKETGEWGFAGDRGSYSIDGMIMGMAMDLTYRDSLNYPNMKINTDRNIEIGERLRSLFQNDSSANCDESARNTFASGKAMLMTHVLGTAGKELKSTTLEYMVIPVPMYDEFQEAYHIIPQDNFSSLSLLVHVTTEQTIVTQILEVMGSESYLSLRHCIQEKCYKQRYLKTEPRGKMFDYIVDNMYYDFGYTYAKMLDKPVMLIRNYARVLPGEQGYVESLVTQLEITEVTSEEKLKEFLKQFFE
ncbi:MAG: hypothetical protein IKA76_01150 [Clostridia bacterium]|nr:hypothetical protein [Clostridia bacterium]